MVSASSGLDLEKSSPMVSVSRWFALDTRWFNLEKLSARLPARWSVRWSRGTKSIKKWLPKYGIQIIFRPPSPRPRDHFPRLRPHSDATSQGTHTSFIKKLLTSQRRGDGPCSCDLHNDNDNQMQCFHYPDRSMFYLCLEMPCTTWTIVYWKHRSDPFSGHPSRGSGAAPEIFWLFLEGLLGEGVYVGLAPSLMGNCSLESVGGCKSSILQPLNCSHYLHNSIREVITYGIACCTGTPTRSPSGSCGCSVSGP